MQVYAVLFLQLFCRFEVFPNETFSIMGYKILSISVMCAEE